MNVKLLRKVKKHILEEPRRLVMDMWLVRKSRPEHKLSTDGFRNINFAKCGTAACIAGWACLLSGESNIESREVEERGRQLLGLDDPERLFDRHEWPEALSEAYRRAKSQKERAKIAAERIEHFIATKGAE